MKPLHIVKIGGNVIDNEASLQTFLDDFAQLSSPKILVHGGGKLASQLSEKLNIPVEMVDGRRITDIETLDIITMVYAGKINKNIIAALQARQVNAIGFTGADGNTVTAKKRPTHPIDFGWVGDVTSVNTKLISSLLNNSITPVFCAITHDGNGHLFNTNADTIASSLAVALSKAFKTILYYCFDKAGVLQSIDDANSTITSINSLQYQQLISENIISEGMLPKLKNCIDAVHNGVSKVCLGLPEMIQPTPVSKFTTITR